MAPIHCKIRQGPIHQKKLQKVSMQGSILYPSSFLHCIHFYWLICLINCYISSDTGTFFGRLICLFQLGGSISNVFPSFSVVSFNLCLPPIMFPYGVACCVVRGWHRSHLTSPAPVVAGVTLLYPDTGGPCHVTDTDLLSTSRSAIWTRFPHLSPSSWQRGLVTARISPTTYTLTCWEK